MNSPSPERAAIRRLIYTVMRQDSDLEAFCLDHFPDVYSRFSTNMDRIAKVTLLLAVADSRAVLDKIRTVHPAACSQHEAILKHHGPPSQEVNAELVEELDRLYQLREATALRGESSSSVDAAIRELKRQMRQGPQLRAGEILRERYKLDQVIGSGGFADVWLAWDRKRTTFVALKVLHGRWSPKQDQWQRFARGARTMSRLSQQHPGFVKVLSDDLYEENGFHYFVMEYLPGGDLRRAVLDWHLNSAQAIAAVLQVGEALHFAHQQGLVHRDVKPQNILLDAVNKARLSDFDLAMVPDSTGNTRTGPMGTFIYAAPEEMEDGKRVDHRTDVYSLGMTALFVLYGKDLPTRVIQSASKFVDQLQCSKLLKTVLSRAIAWEAKDRYQNAAELCRELGAALANNAESHKADSKSPECTPVHISLNSISKISKYKIKRLISKQGLAEVYESIDERTGQRIAIKVFCSKLTTDQSASSKWSFEEFRILSIIDHPSIIKIFEYNILEDGIPYVIMEYLEGQTLREHLRSLKADNKILPLDRTLNIAWQLASAMATLHKHGMVHQNLKPGNIVLVSNKTSPGGEYIKLLDSGIARLGDGNKNQEDGGPGRCAGTPAYMSPEQWRGEVDGRADVYSFGVMLYEILSGCRPFEGEISNVALSHLFNIPKSLSVIAPGIPEPLAVLIHRMLSKDRELRPSMEDLMQQFRKWIDNHTLSTSKPLHANIRIEAIKAPGYKKWRNVSVGIFFVGFLCAAIYFLLGR